MNTLTLRTLLTFPAELQHRVRAHRLDNIDELVQQVALALLEASRDDTMRAIFNRARSACRRFTQDLAHYGRSLDGVANADTHTPAGAKKKRGIAREVSADFRVGVARARQIVRAQIERARMGDLFADDGSDGSDGSDDDGSGRV